MTDKTTSEAPYDEWERKYVTPLVSDFQDLRLGEDVRYVARKHLLPLLVELEDLRRRLYES